jgi:hypothetical protein
MRIDHLLVTAPSRMVWAEIDREGGRGSLYRRITHPWSSTSTAPAFRSTPAGLRRNRKLRRAFRSRDKANAGWQALYGELCKFWLLNFPINAVLASGCGEFRRQAEGGLQKTSDSLIFSLLLILLFVHPIILNQSLTERFSRSISSSEIGQQCAIGPRRRLRLFITRVTAR